MKNKTKKKIAWIITPILALWGGTEVYLGSDKWYEVDNYKWVTVTHERYKCGYWSREDVLGCYFFAWPNKWTINMERWINRDQYQYILDHEYAHHVWFMKMNDKERDLWYFVWDEDRFTSFLNKRWFTLIPEFVSWYAETNDTEDFAESYARGINRDYPYRSYAWVKQKIAEYFVNKYDPTLR